MFEKLRSVKIKNSFFENETTLSVLHANKPVSIIYGKNGSGKTNLSETFKQYATGKEDIQFDLLDGSDNSISSAIDKTAIHVFNETFIHNKVQFTEADGLDSIVMLGDTGDIQNIIEECDATLLRIKTELENTQQQEAKCLNSNDTESPDYYALKIQSELRSNWAEREQRIKSLSQRATVNDALKSRVFVCLETVRDKTILIDELNTAIEEIAKSKTATPIDISSIHKLPTIELQNHRIMDLLGKAIPEPVLTEKEATIKLFVEKGRDAHFYEDVRISFSSDDERICPYCLRDIEADEKSAVIEAIAHVFDTQESETHQQELQKALLNEYNLDLSGFAAVKHELVQSLENALYEYNKTVRRINVQIADKQRRIFIPIVADGIDIEEKTADVNRSVDQLLFEVKNYNNSISETARQKLRDNASTLNLQLAAEEIREYKNQESIKAEAYNRIKEKKTAKENEKTAVEKRRAEKEADKKNIAIALERINRHLRYIFFDVNRLSVRAEADKYQVLSRGHNIRLKSLSAGERNAIALCYFFSLLSQDKSPDKALSDEMLLVIDDPISSFDFENKTGIYSFLHLMIDRIRNGNNNSRIIILTHEIEAMRHLQNVLKDSEIADNHVYELQNHNIKTTKDRSEYTELLNTVFQYANENSEFDCFSDAIGNIMRRILEAFGTFLYKTGITQLSTKPEILGQIADEYKQEYFSCLMYRLLLHSGSHFQESIEAMPETETLNYFSEEEKRRTAREILVFMNLLNPLHIEKHLSQSGGASKTITEWEYTIFPPT
jgi:wobble nucleotide-excising tRNase